MTQFRSAAGKLIIASVLSYILLFSNKTYSQDGKQLFLSNCSSCHDPKFQKNLTGPNLAGVEDRWTDKKMLNAWIKNNPEVLKSGYKYAVDLYNANNKTPMNVFTNLSDKDIDAILGFIKTEPAKIAAASAAGAGGGNASGAATAESDNSLLFGILSLVLAIVAFILLQVNANLRKMADDKEGIPAREPIAFWKNKTYIMFGAILLFLIGGYYTVMGAIGLGRQQDYEPEQPIFYSHKVHAGVNQINCLYCHGGAQESKHASIPSVNICMNCHMAINEYTKGPKLFTAEGKEVNGTREIQKLYSYAGFEPGKPWDASKAKPIEWTRVHALPDHVYFNHSQHVMVGKVQCQTCHGEITKMDEVKQFSELSMGWCINCHRTTSVKFNDNGFYSIYEKYHEDLKNGIRDSITVFDIGGTECQKCHY